MRVYERCELFSKRSSQMEYIQ